MIFSRREFLASAGSLAVVGAFGKPLKIGKSIVIAHISDVHVSQMCETDEIRKVVGEINGDSEIDFVVVTGDLQNRGQLSEMLTAKSWYDLIEKPKALCPGNHEMQYAGSRENWKKTFGEASGRWRFAGVPVYGVDSTPPGYQASGFFRADEMAALTGRLIDDDARGAPLAVFLTHYSPTPECANWWLLPQAIKKAGVENALILSGHIHQFMAWSWEGYLGFAARALKVNKRHAGRKGSGYVKLTIEPGGRVLAQERIVGEPADNPEWDLLLKYGANEKRKDVSRPKVKPVPVPEGAFDVVETGVFKYPEFPPPFTDEEVRLRKRLSKELSRKYRNFRVSPCCRELSLNGIVYVPGSRGLLVAVDEKTREVLRSVVCGSSSLCRLDKAPNGVRVALAEGRSFTLKEVR